MVSEGTEIRRFVSRELHRCSDLSTLTLGILRKKYLEHVGRDSLSAEHRQLLKQILEEELMEMQDSSSDDEPLISSVAPSKKQSKRKREDEDEEEAQNKEDMSRKKKSRFAPDSPDSPDSGIEKIANEEMVKEEHDYEHDDDDDEGSDQNIEEESEEEQNAKVRQKNTKENSNVMNRKGDMCSESDEEEEKNKAKKNGKVLDSEEDDHISSSSSDEDKENQQVHPRDEKKSNSEEEKVSEKELKHKDIGNRKKAKGRSGKKRQSASSDSLEEMSGEETKPKGEKKYVGKRINADGQKKRKNTEDKKEQKPTESEAVRKVQKEVFGSSSESEEDEAKKTERKGTSESSDEGSDKEPEKKKEDDEVSSDEVTETAKANNNDRNEAEDSDSSSSSLPSLDDDEEAEGTKPKQEEEKKKKSAPKKKSTEMSESKDKRGKEDENKAVSRLKRYIALCGVRRNYKKLFEGCRSVKAKVAVLKKELEELGVEGQPSIEKCKKARMKREEAQELAELDVSNIITTQGRSKRRAAAPWTNLQSSSPLPSAYKRVVNSDSDSEEGSTDKGRKRTTDWSNLRGIISDDAASD